MASTAHTTASGTIYHPAETFDIPRLDLLSLLFDSKCTDSQEDTVIHASAANPSIALTKAELRTQTRRTAHMLRSTYGIGANGPNKDIVTVVSTGSQFVPLLFYGIIAAGGVFSAVSPASTTSELARLISTAGSKCIICNEATKDLTIQAAGEADLPYDSVCVISEGATWSVRKLGHEQNLITTQELDWQRITDLKTLEESLIVLIYSSGTTGLPKGVCLSHTNLVSEAVVTLELTKKRYKIVGKENFQYRTLAHLPIAHIAGIQGYFINPFYMNGTTYWMSKFSFPEFLEYNKKYRITFFFTVPPIYLLIAKSPLVKDHFDTLEHAVSGAAPLGKELQYAASAKLGKGKTFVSQTWGLSETTGSITAMPYGLNDDTGSVSSLVPNCYARVVDETEKDVPVGERGELWVKGPVVTKGYYSNADANADAYTDGWFRTGDIGYFANGLFYCVDRMKELIKYKGLQVAPAELEALLLTHPLIADAAVIGITTEDGTNELPRAYVVADNSAISEMDIKDWVATKVAGHKQLRGGVVFVDVIPKSPSGKILRKDLRALAKRVDGAKL
ncbi:acetyl-CoA synthetase-like protein [Pseudovirgaria hyperparasitica]|uniref:Acetyl-CoA synthetase-like protein n=1 Tax=Pseudovirgaria hyperparasitica TaxID=470096 RepID=A0A6A6WI62_9PEZI|nr:acetyl-CoA synthetase-like protein [Pseudovirgaria hyperparasitica]KAF2762492.1 acetyl-CoA synthetase-like protein [Pseudovirgaria hyperparasitica]